MNCKQVEKNMFFYIDKELSNEMANSFEMHIVECQHCNHLYKNIKTIIQAIETEKNQADDFYFYARLKQRMENQQYKKNAINFMPKRLLQPIAIACLVIIGIFTGIKIGNQYNTSNVNLTAEETRTLQLNAYSEETYIAEINNEKMESLLTSN